MACPAFWDEHWPIADRGLGFGGGGGFRLSAQGPEFFRGCRLMNQRARTRNIPAIPIHKYRMADPLTTEARGRDPSAVSQNASAPALRTAPPASRHASVASQSIR